MEQVTCSNCSGTGRTGSTLTDEDGYTVRAPAACGLCNGTGTLAGRW